MGRTSCTEPQCLYKGALHAVIKNSEIIEVSTFTLVSFRLSQNIPRHVSVVHFFLFRTAQFKRYWYSTQRIATD